MKRALSLKSETLTELTFGELRAVNGGNTPHCASQDCATVGVLCGLSLAVCEIVETIRP